MADSYLSALLNRNLIEQDGEIEHRRGYKIASRGLAFLNVYAELKRVLGEEKSLLTSMTTMNSWI